MTWTKTLRGRGADFLGWLAENGRLQARCTLLSEELEQLVRTRVTTAEDADAVWEAIPAILHRCNDPETYTLGGAATAYACVHMLDRYVRTWRALELLVEDCSLPMGRYGAYCLDVGTGPGPSSFAVHDFYAEMLQFFSTSTTAMPNPPATVTCVELDKATNSLRHHLAERVAMRAPIPCSITSLCSAIPDLAKINWPEERRATFEAERREILYSDVTVPEST